MFEIYTDLWAFAEQIGRTVTTKGRRSIYVNERRTETAASSFNPEGAGGHPELRIHNPDRTDPTARPINDPRVRLKLVTLAHECGHATSWSTNADGAWDDYFLAINRRYGVQTSVALRNFGVSGDALARATVDAIVRHLSEHERTLIWVEENRAWDTGEQFLRERGFDDQLFVTRRRAAALRSHAVMLGRVPFERGDLEPI